MKNTCNNFSVIIPVLGTKKELKFAEKTIPAIIDLNPHEIIFGIDAPENQTLISTLDQLCTKKNLTDNDMLQANVTKIGICSYVT